MALVIGAVKVPSEVYAPLPDFWATDTVYTHTQHISSQQQVWCELHIAVHLLNKVQDDVV